MTHLLEYRWTAKQFTNRSWKREKKKKPCQVYKTLTEWLHGNFFQKFEKQRVLINNKTRSRLRERFTHNKQK
jgi:hypothetical protein